MSNEEFAELVNSIADTGNDPAHPIFFTSTKSLDGRNRYRAAIKTGVEPIYAEWKGGNPWKFVWKENATRRHLDAGTKAACYRVNHRGSEAFEAEQRARRAAANTRRSEAMNGRPYAPKGGSRGESPVSRDTRPLSESERNRARKQDAKAAGVSEATMGRTHALEHARPDLLERVSKREITLFEALRQKRKAEVHTRLADLPRDKFRVIYADPPWPYHNHSRRGAADDHYPTMELTEICAIDVASIVHDDAVLFLWATSPLLPEAREVMKAWGFIYKSCFVWDKLKTNFGNYNLVRHEFLLIGTRGSCLPESDKPFDSVQSIKRSDHSRKPAEFRQIIDTLYPSGARLELFARGQVPAPWRTWGAEAR